MTQQDRTEENRTEQTELNNITELNRTEPAAFPNAFASPATPFGSCGAQDVSHQCSRRGPAKDYRVI